MRIIDDVMPQIMQHQLHEMAINTDFHWSFLNDVTFYKDDLANTMNKPRIPGFSHVAFNEYRPQTDIMNYMSSMVLCMSEKAGTNPAELFRVKFGMYLPIKDAPLHNNIHTDMKCPHTVCLYYVNDADGDTFFFDKNREIVDRVTPKKGRMVVFDGLTLHASSMPSKDYRISLNLGYANPQHLKKV